MGKIEGVSVAVLGLILTGVLYAMDWQREQDEKVVTFSGGGTAELVLHYGNGTTGELYFAMISGSVPADNETFTTTGTFAGSVDGTPFLSRFPLKIRDDLTYTASTGAIRLDAGIHAIGTTHSFLYDTESGGGS